MIRKGDILRIKPEWQDKGDALKTWVARADQVGDDASATVDISCLEERSALWPWQRVRASMVEATGRNILEQL
jgi:hypothetical protein